MHELGIVFHIIRSVEEVPAVTFCESCGRTYGTVEYGRVCPHCGSERTYLIQGEESVIKEIATPDDE